MCRQAAFQAAGQAAAVATSTRPTDEAQLGQAARLDRIARAIVTQKTAMGGVESLLVAISGIDASGKSTLAAQLVAELNRIGQRSALISLDAWHHPLEKRFSATCPAEHFYENAFRFDELFRLLIRPLRRDRFIHLTTCLNRLPQNDFFYHTYEFSDVDVILLEGIFLLKREWKNTYDLSLWIDCSFETALRRAIARNQEGLTVAEIVRDYKTIYFPAQRIHLARDDPRSSADWIVQ